MHPKAKQRLSYNEGSDFSLIFFFLPMQTSSVFHSASMWGDHRFGRIEMVSSQNSEEREKEMSPQLHPEALVAGFRRSGSQSPDSRLVGDEALPSPPGTGGGVRGVASCRPWRVGLAWHRLPGNLGTHDTPSLPHWQKGEVVSGASGLSASRWVKDVVGRPRAMALPTCPSGGIRPCRPLWGFQVQNKSVSFYPVVSVWLFGTVFLFCTLAVF